MVTAGSEDSAQESLTIEQAHGKANDARDGAYIVQQGSHNQVTRTHSKITHGTWSLKLSSSHREDQFNKVKYVSIYTMTYHSRRKPKRHRKVMRHTRHSQGTVLEMPSCTVEWRRKSVGGHLRKSRRLTSKIEERGRRREVRGQGNREDEKQGTR